MILLVNGESLSIRELGPDFLLLEKMVAYPPCRAVIRMWVDGEQDEWSVRLPEGIVSERVALSLP